MRPAYSVSGMSLPAEAAYTLDCTDFVRTTRCAAWGHSSEGMGWSAPSSEGVQMRRTQWFADAHGTLAAISTDDNGCLALSVPSARAGSSRAEFRMKVNSDAT
jgi:hypothetical protein